MPKLTVPDGVKASCCNTPSGDPFASVIVVAVTFKNSGAVLALPAPSWFVLPSPKADPPVEFVAIPPLAGAAGSGCAGVSASPVGFVATPWFAGVVLCPAVG